MFKAEKISFLLTRLCLCHCFVALVGLTTSLWRIEASKMIHTQAMEEERLRLVDAYWDSGCDEIVARLDRVSTLLAGYPESSILVVGYSASDTPVGRLPHHFKVIARHLSVNRGIPSERIHTVDAGIGPAFLIQFWIAHRSYVPPKLETLARVGAWRGEVKYDEGEADAFRENGKYKIFTGVICSLETVDLDALAQTLIDDPSRRARFIVHPGTVLPNVGPQGYAMALRQFLSESRIPSSRYEISVGNRRKVQALEVWLLPSRR